MIVVADASVLVAELLRTRGRALLAHPDLRVVVAQEQWEETQHELLRRIGAIVEQGRLTEEHAKRLHNDVLALVDERAIEIIPRRFYEHMEVLARRRVPRDPHDWPPVALALVLDSGRIPSGRAVGWSGPNQAKDTHVTMRTSTRFWSASSK